MFSVSMLEVGGYIIDGGVLCRECGEERHLKIADSISLYELESNFSIDGIACDCCGKAIVEPIVEESDELD